MVALVQCHDREHNSNCKLVHVSPRLPFKGGGAQQENETSTKGGRTVNFPGHVRRWLVGETDRPAIGNSSSLTSFPLPVVRMKSSSYSSSTWHGVLTGQVEILEIHRLHSVEQAVTSRHAQAMDALLQTEGKLIVHKSALPAGKFSACSSYGETKAQSYSVC